MQARYAELHLKAYATQVMIAARGLSTCPKSKIVKDNLDAFCDMWTGLLGDITSVSKETLEVTQAISKSDRSEYLSLPRPGVSVSNGRCHTHFIRTAGPAPFDWTAQL